MRPNHKLNHNFSIEIDGKDVPMLVSPKAHSLYAYYFKRKLAEDLINNIHTPIKNTHWKVETQRLNKLAQIIWVLAKNADPQLPVFKKWVASLKELPVSQIFDEIVIEITKEMGTDGQ